MHARTHACAHTYTHILEHWCMNEVKNVILLICICTPCSFQINLEMMFLNLSTQEDKGGLREVSLKEGQDLAAVSVCRKVF